MSTTFYHVRAINDLPGTVNPTNIRKGVLRAIEDGADIINISITSSGLEYEEIESFVKNNNVTFVLAGGNRTDDNDHVIAHNAFEGIDGVIIVGGTDIDDKVEFNHNNIPTTLVYGSKIDLCAPGKGFFVLAQDDNSTSMHEVHLGTSQAASMVSATAALMKSVNQSLTPAEIECTIKETTDPIVDDIPGKPWYGLVGSGRLNTYEAVIAAKSQMTIPNVVPNNITLSVSGDHRIDATLRIQKGGKLIIQNATIGFRRHGTIWIEPGGELIMNNCTLKVANNCSGNWKGIRVLGDQNDTGGILRVTNSIFENALMAIEINRGAIAIISNTLFENCKNSITHNGNNILSVQSQGLTTLKNCSFIWSNYYDWFGSNPIHIKLTNNMGANHGYGVHIYSCNFKNEVHKNNWKENSRGIGISSYNFEYEISRTRDLTNPCIPIGDRPLFQGLQVGIDNVGNMGLNVITHSGIAISTPLATDKSIKILSCDFKDNLNGIRNESTARTNVYDCNFEYDLIEYDAFGNMINNGKLYDFFTNDLFTTNYFEGIKSNQNRAPHYVSNNFIFEGDKSNNDIYIGLNISDMPKYWLGLLFFSGTNSGAIGLHREYIGNSFKSNQTLSHNIGTVISPMAQLSNITQLEGIHCNFFDGKLWHGIHHNNTLGYKLTIDRAYRYTLDDLLTYQNQFPPDNTIKGNDLWFEPCNNVQTNPLLSRFSIYTQDLSSAYLHQAFASRSNWFPPGLQPMLYPFSKEICVYPDPLDPAYPQQNNYPYLNYMEGIIQHRVYHDFPNCSEGSLNIPISNAYCPGYDGVIGSYDDGEGMIYITREGEITGNPWGGGEGGQPPLDPNLDRYNNLEEALFDSLRQVVFSDSYHSSEKGYAASLLSHFYNEFHQIIDDIPVSEHFNNSNFEYNSQSEMNITEDLKPEDKIYLINLGSLEFEIQNNDTEQYKVVTIFDQSGRRLPHQDFKTEGNRIKFDRSVRWGVYFIHLDGGNLPPIVEKVLIIND